MTRLAACNKCNQEINLDRDNYQSMALGYLCSECTFVDEKPIHTPLLNPKFKVENDKLIIMISDQEFECPEACLNNLSLSRRSILIDLDNANDRIGRLELINDNLKLAGQRNDIILSAIKALVGEDKI